MEPIAVSFPHARTAVHVRSYRKLRTGKESWEDRYYISTRPADRHTAAEWSGLIRGHWAGVENRNHWRKDACLFEDKTRSRNPNIVGALILLRNVVLRYYADHGALYASLPAFVEANAAHTKLPFKLVTGG